MYCYYAERSRDVIRSRPIQNSHQCVVRQSWQKYSESKSETARLWITGGGVELFSKPGNSYFSTFGASRAAAFWASFIFCALCDYTLRRWLQSKSNLLTNIEVRLHLTVICHLKIPPLLYTLERGVLIIAGYRVQQAVSSIFTWRAILTFTFGHCSIV